MEEFVKEYSVYGVLVVMVVEYLIGASKLKSNSVIELALDVMKMIFVKKDELEPPK